MDVNLGAYLKQRNPQVANDGVPGKLRGSRVGQLFTAGWREELLMAGHCFNVTVGGVSAGADVALIQGGGAGTTIDSDQPELAVSVPAGYYMVPLRFQFSGQIDLDADAEVANILLFADTTQALSVPIAASSTIETPVNLLGGGPTSVAYAQSAVTTDITDPVVSVLLGYKTIRAMDAGTVASEQVAELSMEYQPASPILLKGPAMVVACWGGTAAVNGAATFDWAEVPSGRYGLE